MTRDPSGRSGVLVVGQIARDLVLAVPAIPDAGGSVPVRERAERVGGKGANQAVGLRQLGVERVALLGVAGADAAGDEVIAQARQDGIAVDAVSRRGTTALLVDVVDADGARRLLEHVPPEALLTVEDVRRASALVTTADTVVLQLQQPADALLAAAEAARDAGARVVLDGGVEGDARDRLLHLADVVRMDAVEAAQLTDVDIASRADAERAARSVLDAGPGIVAAAVPGEGDLVVWREGLLMLPYSDATVVDPTGAGDAFVAGLVAALRTGASPAEAGRLASAAAGATVGRLGGRPDLAGVA
jgi:ribokinase